MPSPFLSLFRRNRPTMKYSLAILLGFQTVFLLAQQPDAALLRHLRETQQVYVNFHRSTGAPSFVRWPDHAPLALPRNTLREKASSFFEQYGRLFGISDAAAELEFVSESTDKTGMKHLKFKQLHIGVEVFGGELLLHFDAEGRFQAANGVFIPGIRHQYAQPLQSIAQAEAVAIIIPPAGEIVKLGEIGNHSKGTRFINAAAHIDDTLRESFDRISRRIEGFHYGRFDIKCDSFEELRRGENFIILEINGTCSEPTHIYDEQANTYGYALREIIRHWDIVYRMGTALHRRGVPYLPAKEMIAAFRALGRQLKKNG